MRNIIIVAPQFPPCNLTAVHRSRIFARHLPEFGYQPIILTVRREYYEETIDLELELLLPNDLQIVRTRAIPTRPIRLIGDIGLRSFFAHLLALRRLIASNPIDLVLFPIPPNYTCLLGPIIKACHGIPYVIDYIDPWVYPMTQDERRSWKSRASHWLARRLEPIAIRSVDGITSVAESYYAGVLERHPQLHTIPKTAMPYGAAIEDHAFISQINRHSRVLDSLKVQGKHVFTYAGAALPRATETYCALFESLSRLKHESPSAAARIHMVFVGTSASAATAGAGPIAPIASKFGVSDAVSELPGREPYLEVLAMLHRSAVIMVLGSSERHYTPSKVYQAMCARRPILGILHEESLAVKTLRDISGVELITISDTHPVNARIPEITASLARISAGSSDRTVDYPSDILRDVSARQVTAQLASFLDTVISGAAKRRTGNPRKPQ